MDLDYIIFPVFVKEKLDMVPFPELFIIRMNALIQTDYLRVLIQNLQFHTWQHFYQ